jgi:ABC-type glycerol-3-phosphate transport system substrate-binding protein
MRLQSRHTALARLVAGGAVAVLLVAACSGSSATQAPAASQAAGGGGAAATPYVDPNATDSGGKIMVWVDAPRQPAAEAFQKAYPDIPIEINAIPGNVGSTDLQQKFALFNQAGKGWPDAIFFPSNDDIAWATSAKINYARDLSVELKDYLTGYTAANNAPCNIDNQVRCLRNDSAPDVFWYNKSLFDEWGYKPPTTWEEYQDLGIKIATEHPGYISGFLGDAYAPDRYLWASGCPTNDRLSETKVHINTADPMCKRAVDMVDKMIAAKALSPVGIFDPNAAELGPKLAMSPGAVWWGNYLFRDTWKIPAGQMTATNPLNWTGETPGFTGDEGGGLWGISSHIKGKQLENALTFGKFVSSDPRWQVELSTGLPAYTAPQQAWLDKGAKDGYFADYPTTSKAFIEAGNRVRPNHYYMLYNTGGIWSKTVTPVLTAGKDLSAAWDAFGQQLVNEAKTFGYEVVDSGS